MEMLWAYHNRAYEPMRDPVEKHHHTGDRVSGDFDASFLDATRSQRLGNNVHIDFFVGYIKNTN